MDTEQQEEFTDTDTERQYTDDVAINMGLVEAMLAYNPQEVCAAFDMYSHTRNQEQADHILETETDQEDPNYEEVIRAALVKQGFTSYGAEGILYNHMLQLMDQAIEGTTEQLKRITDHRDSVGLKLRAWEELEEPQDEDT
ncbi:hypothetical protein N9937_01050 [bacterium]|nr:hypothetical protein [bacterium]